MSEGAEKRERASSRTRGLSAGRGRRLEPQLLGAEFEFSVDDLKRRANAVEGVRFDVDVEGLARRVDVSDLDASREGA